MPMSICRRLGVGDILLRYMIPRWSLYPRALQRVWCGCMRRTCCWQSRVNQRRPSQSLLIRTTLPRWRLITKARSLPPRPSKYDLQCQSWTSLLESFCWSADWLRRLAFGITHFSLLVTLTKFSSSCSNRLIIAL